MEDSASVKVPTLDERGYMIPINVGTLAVIIISVVTSCSLLTLLSMYCWRRFSSDINVTCSRCHQLIAVQGAVKPRHIVQQYYVVQPQAQHHHQQTFFQAGPDMQGHVTDMQGHVTASLAGLPGSRQPQQQYQQQQQYQRQHQHQGGRRSHQYENVPEIVIDHPQPNLVNCGDSATFQRLGMREQRQSGVSQVSDEARALETQALSLVQSSPPDQNSPGLEPLTPSPVSLHPQHHQLGHVKMVNFPSHQTPCVKTPANALKRRKSALKQQGKQDGAASSERTVTLVQPERRGQSNGGQEYSVLEASHMAGSDLTTGDLRDLVDSVQDSSVGGRNHSNSTNDTKTITPGSVFSSNISTPVIMKMAKGYQEQDRRRREEELFRASFEDQSLEKSAVTPESSLARPDHVSVRGEENSPYLAILSHQGKVINRRSVSSPNIAISGHDQHVTDRRSQNQQNPHSPENFRFDNNFNPSCPRLLEDFHRKNTKTTTPSKIPISQAYLIDKTPLREGVTEVEKTPGSSEKKKSASKIPRPESTKKKEKKDLVLPPRSQRATNYEENIQRNSKNENGERSHNLQNSLKLVQHANYTRT